MFWQNKKVLITGGTGFIGRHMTELLLEKKAIITIPSTQAKKYKSTPPFDKTNVIQANLINLEDAVLCVKGQDIVIHLAANIGSMEYIMNHPASVYRTNTQMFMNIIEASRLAGVKRFLVTSTACVYPKDCTIPTPEEEGFVGTPNPAHEGHGWSKRMEEFLAHAYHKEFELNVAIARLYNIYGPHDHFDSDTPGVIPSLIKKIDSAQDTVEVWGDGTSSRSFLYVKDCVEGLLQIAEKAPPNETYNLGTDEEITIKDLAQLLVKLSGKKLKLAFDTSKPGGQINRRCSTTKTIRDIGFKAKQSLEAGLTETMQWYAQRNNCV